jgi:hypothetical protein
MLEMLLTLSILITPLDDGELRWKLEGVPNQLQVMFKHGVEVSFPYKVNDCRTLTAINSEVIFSSKDNVCYIIDASQPSMVRTKGAWHGATPHTYQGGE